MDSNHRSRKTADLQSAPFGHSGIRPYVFILTAPSNREKRLGACSQNHGGKNFCTRLFTGGAIGEKRVQI